MLRRHMLGRGPINQPPHDTLFRCLSAWVDVFQPTGRCMYSTVPTSGARQARTTKALHTDNSIESDHVRWRTSPDRHPWQSAALILKPGWRPIERGRRKEDMLSPWPKPDDVPPPSVPPQPPDTYDDEAKIDIGSQDDLDFLENVDNLRVTGLDDDALPISRGAFRLQQMFAPTPLGKPDMEPPPHRVLFRWYLIAREAGELAYLARSGILSSLIALFGSRSIAHSRIPGTSVQKFYADTAYEQNIDVHHPFTAWIRKDFRRLTHWEYVRRIARDKQEVGFPLTYRDTYWLFMAHLANAHRTQNVLRRKVAMGSVRRLFPTLQRWRRVRVYVPYVYGLLSLPLTEDIMGEAIRAIVRYHSSRVQGMRRMPLPELYSELLRACWQCNMPHLAEPLIQSLAEVTHSEWRRRSPAEDINDFGVAPFSPIPSTEDLHAFLLGAILPGSNVVHRYSEAGYYDQSLRLWARKEMDDVMSNPSEALPNLMLVLLPSLPRNARRYELDSTASTGSPQTVEGVSSNTSWTVACGLATLKSACIHGRPERLEEIRGRLWTSWMQALPSCRVHPIVHFSILLSFLQLAEIPEDAAYASEVVDWIFQNPQVLQLSNIPSEVTTWQTELTVALLKAVVCVAYPGHLPLFPFWKRTRRLFSKGHEQTDLILNRLVHALLPSNVALACAVLEDAKGAQIDIWPATITGFFFNALSDGRLDLSFKVLQPNWLQDDGQRRLHMQILIENVTRDAEVRLPQDQRSIFGRALAQALKSEIKLLPQTWKAALLVLIRSGDLKWPVSLVERLDELLRSGRLPGRLGEYVPRRLYRNVPASGSKELIKRLGRLIGKIPHLSKLPQEPTSDPAVVFATQLRRPVAQMIWQHNQPYVHNLVLTKALRVATRKGSNLSTSKLARNMLLKLSWGDAAVDPVTVNLLLHSVLRWDRSIPLRTLWSLFDRLFVLGYPGSDAYPSGLFGTINDSNLSPHPPQRSIHPARHARPLYKMFIRAFARAGDWESARAVVGLLTVAKEAEIARQRAELRERRSRSTYLVNRRQYLLRWRPKWEDPQIWEGLTINQIKKRLWSKFFYHMPLAQDELFYSVGEPM
ncbi:hypothetical protein CALCODRAFT_98899 [Calocera cornea HHB12733]|uniref:Uncharacterized protein n=1 Tax=Calocera cornea HHB12733 TaxID=1353952 RepID=A0A165D772_9BASI|nr:hypothetical protein CALCODRAFT_98899 [Calocera cornea HHB12733]